MSDYSYTLSVTTTKGKTMTFTNEELALIAAALEFYGGMTDDEVTMQQDIVSRIYSTVEV
jgi:hypothetical protein